MDKGKIKKIAIAIVLILLSGSQQALALDESQTTVAVNPASSGMPVVVTKPLTYEQSQQNMLKTAPAVNIPTSPDSTAAFNELLQQNLPLTPQQVVRLRQLIDVSQRAAAIPANVPPKPVSTTLMINLAPGTTPPAIRLAQGYVTSLVFVDSTGSPWPIAAYDIGDPKTANIQWDSKSNVMLIVILSSVW
jgi:intracellular multiplication protein IcmK